MKKKKEEKKESNPWRGHLISGGIINASAIAFTRDSKYLFSCTEEIINMHLVSSGKKVRVLRGHSAQVTGVGISPKNYLQLYSVGLDGNLCLWNYNDAILLKKMDVGRPITSFCFHPTTNEIYMYCRGSSQTGIYIFDIIMESISQPKSLNFNEQCTSITIDSGGDFLLMKLPKSVLIVNLKTQTTCLFEHHLKIMALAVHPTEYYFSIGDETGKIICVYYSEPCLKTVFMKQWHQKPIGGIIFNEEGSQMISVGGETTILFTQLKTKVFDFLPRLGGFAIKGIIRSPNSQYFALICGDNRIRIVDAAKKSTEIAISGLSKVLSITVPPNQNHIVINSTSGCLQLYDPYTDSEVSRLQVSRYDYSGKQKYNLLPESEIRFFRFSSDGNWICTVDKIYFGDKSEKLQFWKFNSEKEIFELNTKAEAPHKNSNVTAMAYHPKENVCVTCSEDGKFKIWEQKTTTTTTKNSTQPIHQWHQRSTSFYQENQPITSADFSPDGSTLALTHGHVITLWDPETNFLLRPLTISIPGDPLVGLKHVMVTRGTWFLVAFSCRKIFVWNILRGDLEWVVDFEVRFLVVDPVAPQFMVYSLDREVGVITLFSPESPFPIYYWYLHKTPLKGITFLPAPTSRDSEEAPEIETSESRIVYIDHKNRVHVIQKGDLDKSIFDKTLNQTLLTEYPTLFQQLYAKEVPTLEEEDIKEMEDKPEVAAQDPLSQIVSSIFSGPSHVLPAPLVVYDTFMERLVQKIPEKPYPETDRRKDEITEKQENRKMDTERPTEGEKGSGPHLERTMLRHVMALSQNKPVPQEQLTFLVDFFKDHFSFSEQPVPFKIPLREVRKRKRTEEQSAEENPETPKVPEITKVPEISKGKDKRKILEIPEIVEIPEILEIRESGDTGDTGDTEIPEIPVIPEKRKNKKRKRKSIAPQMATQLGRIYPMVGVTSRQRRRRHSTKM